MLLLTAFCLLPSALCVAQQPTPPTQVKQPAVMTSPAAAAEQEETPLPGDWGPDLLDAILSSPNPQAGDALLRAAFAAGPAVIPRLEAALKDDRTAEFAAQALAFIGGEKALAVLWKLQTDPRDLNLRRFYYGALGEYASPQATQILSEVINRSDAEPDRTVTEAAILALTVHSDATLVPKLKEAAAKLQDVVIRDDLDNALAVIEARSKYLATPEGKKAGSSIEQAVRTYFYPALEPPPPETPSKPPAKPATPEPSLVKVNIQQLTFSPDNSRALARVVFEDPTALAYYDMVLQKQYGEWAVANVWLGSEAEKTPPAPAKAPAKQP